jgi:hypothetical protein
MAKILLTILGLIMIQNSAAASAGASGVGAGIVLGSPTGLTAKMWQDSQVAYDAGFSFSNSDYFLFYADYLLHYPGSIKNKNQFISQLTPYWGVGGILVMTSSSRDSNSKYLGKNSGAVGLGVRVPFGVEWRPGQPPLGFFAELSPGISIFPATDILFQGGIGMRYYF